MAEQPEVTLENLREVTNTLEARGADELQGVPDSGSGSVPEGTQNQPDPQKAESTPPGQGLPEEVVKSLSDTPYKSVDELIKGYKNAVGELTKRTQETKPYEQFLKRITTDRNFANFVEQARQVYENPQLAQAYINQQGQVLSGEPDPRNYFSDGFVSPDGLAKYQADVRAYLQRDVDARLNARLSQIEGHNRLENLKLQFKQKFPDANPDEILQKWEAEAQNFNPYEIAHKFLAYDAIESRMLEKARKELTKQLETAQNSGTPKAAASPGTKAKPDDIIDYITAHGTEAAFKKFGRGDVMEVVQRYS